MDITQYGAIVADLAADKFWLNLRARLTDKLRGKTFWEETFNLGLDLPGKVAALEADNQKTLKEGVDRMVEEVCRRIL